MLRSTLDYRPVAQCVEDLRIKCWVDEIYLRDPCIGTRQLRELLQRDHGPIVSRKRLQRLWRSMGLETIWCRPRTQRRTNTPTCCATWK